MTKRKPLEWYADEDGSVGIPDCMVCFDRMNTSGLIEACASVGIEVGKSTGQLLRDYIEDFHARRHA